MFFFLVTLDVHFFPFSWPCKIALGKKMNPGTICTLHPLLSLDFSDVTAIVIRFETEIRYPHTHTHAQPVTHAQVSHEASLQCCTFLWICSNNIHELEGLGRGPGSSPRFWVINAASAEGLQGLLKQGSAWLDTLLLLPPNC